MSRPITCILVNEYLRPGVEGKEELTVKETKNHSYMYNYILYSTVGSSRSIVHIVSINMRYLTLTLA